MADFKVGDRVRATLGENVLVGDVIRADLKLIRSADNGPWLALRLGGTNIDRTIWIHEGWHIEKVSPPLPTKHGAVIGHKTDSNWTHYVLIDGEWYCPGEVSATPEEEVRHFIENRGFEVIFEGVDQ